LSITKKTITDIQTEYQSGVSAHANNTTTAHGVTGEIVGTTTPSPQTATVTVGQTTSVTGTYVFIPSCGGKIDADTNAGYVIATRCRDDRLKAGMIAVKNGVSL
jgi:hypothetical protein